jgi:protein-S-isoprenylcysteine O-methyltransferase Ste14
MNRYSKVRILFFLLTFRLLVGFVVAVWSPYSILSMHPGKSFKELVPLTVAGALLISAGVLGYLWCAWDFAFTGLSFGPSVPVERGAYGLVRHPMCLSLTVVLFGESLCFKSWRLLGVCVGVRPAHAYIRAPLRRTGHGEEVGYCLSEVC